MKKNSSSFFWQLARYPITTIFSGWQYVAALRQNGRSHYEYSTHKHSPLHRVGTELGFSLEKLREPYGTKPEGPKGTWGTRRELKGPEGTRRDLKGPEGTWRDPKEPKGIQRDLKVPRSEGLEGIRRNLKEPEGTQRNPKEPKGTRRDPKEMEGSRRDLKDQLRSSRTQGSTNIQ